MLYRLLRRDTSSRVVDEQSFEKIETRVVERCDDGSNVGAVPLGKRGLEVGERCDAWPVVLARGTKDAALVS